MAAKQIIQLDLPQSNDEPGVNSAYFEGPNLDIFSFECWLLTLAPQTCSEGRRGAGEQASIVESCLGKLLLSGAPQRFAAPRTLVLPAFTDYRVVNQGLEPLPLQAVRCSDKQSE